jgi:site-specific recombinase XerD
MDNIIPGSEGSALDLALAAWLDAKSRRSNSRKTHRAYADTMQSFQAELTRVGLALDSDAAAVATVAQVWAGAGEVAAATHNQRLAIISSFYSFARKRGLLQIENPISRVERRPVQLYAQAEALTPDDVRAGLAAIDRSKLVGKRDYALLSVALLTGRRLNEIADLCWRDVRIAPQGSITLSFRTKGSKVMRDTLPRAAGQSITDYLRAFYGKKLETLAQTAPLWVSLSRQNYGAALHPNWLERIARARLGVHFHVLRHTFARTLEDAGAKVSDIQARLGHESLATTGRYLAALRRAENPHAESLAALFGIVGDEPA